MRLSSETENNATLLLLVRHSIIGIYLHELLLPKPIFLRSLHKRSQSLAECRLIFLPLDIGTLYMDTTHNNCNIVSSLITIAPSIESLTDELSASIGWVFILLHYSSNLIIGDEVKNSIGT